MKSTKRVKYKVEHGLHIGINPITLLQQDDLKLSEADEIFKRYPSYVYMICQRPKLSINPKSLKISETEISFDLMFQIKDEKASFPISGTNNIADPVNGFECHYPYNRIAFFQSPNRAFGDLKVSHFLINLVKNNPNLLEHLKVTKTINLLDMEVLYVGQAFGQRGEKMAHKRIEGHETLQRIY